MPAHVINQETGLGDLQEAVKALEQKGETLISVVPLGHQWLVVTSPAQRKRETRAPKKVTATKPETRVKR